MQKDAFYHNIVGRCEQALRCDNCKKPTAKRSRARGWQCRVALCPGCREAGLGCKCTLHQQHTKLLFTGCKAEIRERDEPPEPEETPPATRANATPQCVACQNSGGVLHKGGSGQCGVHICGFCRRRGLHCDCTGTPTPWGTCSPRGAQARAPPAHIDGRGVMHTALTIERATELIEHAHERTLPDMGDLRSQGDREYMGIKIEAVEDLLRAVDQAPGDKGAQQRRLHLQCADGQTTLLLPTDIRTSDTPRRHGQSDMPNHNTLPHDRPSAHDPVGCANQFATKYANLFEAKPSDPEACR